MRLLLLFSFFAFAKIKIDAMSFLSTKRTYRGVVTWNSPYWIGGPAIKYNGWMMRGRKLIYRPFNRKDTFQWYLKLAYIGDNRPLFPLFFEKASQRNQREAALDLEGRMKWRFGYRNLLSASLMLSQELINYKNYYLQGKFTTPIAPYTLLSTILSYAHQKTHKFLYGGNAKTGLGHTSLQLRHILPKKWFTLMTSVEHFWTLRQNHQNADYLVPKHFFSISTRWIFQIY